MTDSLIHLRVPAATKARWVRESRAAGMRLTDWIVERVEMQARVYDVTLYWHVGGSLFLGTAAGRTREEAHKTALDRYMVQSERQRLEIEEGGSFVLESELLPPGWSARRLESHAR